LQPGREKRDVAVRCAASGGRDFDDAFQLHHLYSMDDEAGLLRTPTNFLGDLDRRDIQVG